VRALGLGQHPADRGRIVRTSTPDPHRSAEPISSRPVPGVELQPRAAGSAR
jgi:hypothetical protein